MERIYIVLSAQPDRRAAVAERFFCCFIFFAFGFLLFYFFVCFFFCSTRVLSSMIVPKRAVNEIRGRFGAMGTAVGIVDSGLVAARARDFRNSSRTNANSISLSKCTTVLEGVSTLLDSLIDASEIFSAAWQPRRACLIAHRRVCDSRWSHENVFVTSRYFYRRSAWDFFSG